MREVEGDGIYRPVVAVIGIRAKGASGGHGESRGDAVETVKVHGRRHRTQAAALVHAFRCGCGGIGRRLAGGLVRAVPWLRELNLVAELLLAIRHAVGEDDADALVQKVASP